MPGEKVEEPDEVQLDEEQRQQGLGEGQGQDHQSEEVVSTAMVAEYGAEAFVPADCYECAATGNRKLCLDDESERTGEGTCCLPSDTSQECTTGQQVRCSGTFAEQQELFVKTARAERSVDRLPLTVEPIQQPMLSRSNLPASIDPFIGRDAEVAELNRMLAQETSRLITLTGPGGIV